MLKRFVSGVLCGLITLAVGCGVKKPTPPESCAAIPHKVLVKDGVRYLHATLPDGNVVIVNLDTLPAPAAGAPGSAAAPSSAAGSGGDPVALNHVCPCEEDPCRPLCYQLRTAGPGANLCPPPSAAPAH